MRQCRWPSSLSPRRRCGRSGASTRGGWPPPMDARPRRSLEGSAPAVADERDRPADGVLLLDKPAGLTSHDVVEAVRRSLGGAKTGHAGTLDPFATGLLLVLVGRATKAPRRLVRPPTRHEGVGPRRA